MPRLITDWKGREITRHSFSSGDTFRFCARKYRLEKIDGWAQKEKRASLEFGKCVEAAIVFHHMNGGAGGQVRFTELWEQFAERTDLTYTDREGDFTSLVRQGADMLRLYEIRLPGLPILTTPPPRFQANFRKEIFPGTELAGIEFTAWIDILAAAPLDHPALPAWPANRACGAVRRINIDVKTAAASLDETPGLIALDSQLRAYAWASGIPDVAFLWFVKGGSAVKNGDRVTLLETVGLCAAGAQVAVAAPVEDDGRLWIIPLAAQETLKAHLGTLKGKALDVRRDEFLPRIGALVEPTAVTKVRLQFLTALLTEEDMREAGQVIGKEVAEIHMASEKDFWPKEGGVRFPNQKCTFCQMQPICLGNNVKRDETLIKLDEAWLDQAGSY